MSKKIFALILMTSLLLSCIPFMGVSALEDNIITLDPGHGRGTGATGAMEWGGLQEDHYNLTISLQTEKILKEKYGVQVLMTRTTHDENPGYSDRIYKALDNNSGTFVSIHNNSYSIASLRGSCIFIPNTNYNYDMYLRSYNMGVAIQDRLLNDVGVPIRDRPYSENSGTRPDGSPREKYALLWRAKEWGLRRACIVECCFQSNYTDVHTFLLNPAKLLEMGTAIADGIADHLGLQADTGEKINTINPSAPVANGTASVSLADVTRGENLTFTGWSVHEDGVAGYEYKINDGSWKTVSNAYSSDAVLNSIDLDIFGACTEINSFSQTINTSSLSVGDNTIYVRGVTATGKNYDIGKLTTYAMPAPYETYTKMEKHLFSVGEPIMVTSQGVLEGAWVAIFKAGEVPGDVKSFCYYEMHTSEKTFDMINDAVYNSSRGSSPLPEGTYELYTFVDETYKVNTSVDPITFVIDNDRAATEIIKPATGSGTTADADKEMVFGVKDMKTAEEVEALFDGNCVVTAPDGGKAPDKIGSGCKIYLYDGDFICDSATIIVEGDLTGDGVTNGIDLIRAKKMAQGLSEEGWAEAGDYDRDGSISADDLSNITDSMIAH